MRINHQQHFAVMKSIVRMIPPLFILAMSILHLALPDRTFSKEEQRYLARWPDFHIEAIFDGSYGARIESYFSDQFPWRDFWVRISRN